VTIVKFEGEGRKNNFGENFRLISLVEGMQGCGAVVLARPAIDAPRYFQPSTTT